MGYEVPLSGVVSIIADIVDPDVKKSFHVNKEKPEGVQSKLMDSIRIWDLGWSSKTSLERGIRQTYEWYKNSAHNQSG